MHGNKLAVALNSFINNIYEKKGALDPNAPFFIFYFYLLSSQPLTICEPIGRESREEEEYLQEWLQVAAVQFCEACS